MKVHFDDLLTNILRIAISYRTSIGIFMESICLWETPGLQI